MSLLESLKTIKVLYRRADCLTLYGIPYTMRPGQSPRDLLVRDKWNAPQAGSARPEWVYLGTPGWYNHLTSEEVQLVKKYLQFLGDRVPENPNEWTDLTK